MVRRHSQLVGVTFATSSLPVDRLPQFLDFCSGGKSRTPDETILEIAIAKGFSPDGFIFLATDFYVSQCEADYPYEFLETFERNLDAASTAISAVESAIALISMETIIAECGSDAEGINSLLSAMDSTIQTVGGEVDNVLSTLSCEAVVPSFTSTTYDIACGVSVNSVYYCYVCKFPILNVALVDAFWSFQENMLTLARAFFLLSRKQPSSSWRSVAC